MHSKVPAHASWSTPGVHKQLSGYDAEIGMRH